MLAVERHVRSDMEVEIAMSPTSYANSRQPVMLSVTHKDGTFKAVCRLCEIQNSWKMGSPLCTFVVDALD